MGNEKEERQQRAEKNEREENKNPLEWSIFAVSLLLVLAVIGYLTYKAFSYKKGASPDLKVEYKQDSTITNPYQYHLIVHNNGGETAEDVLLEMLLQANDSILEKSQVTIQFVPEQSRRESWVNFSVDPATADTIVARVVSFRKP